jgi:hypothetical protein
MLKQAPNTIKNIAMPGAELAGGAGGGGMLAGALPALGGMTVVNAATELLDAGGLLPEWAGGDGMGNMGWDQKGFEQVNRDKGYGSAALHGFMNPLKSTTAIGTGVAEGVGAGAGAIRDKITGTDSRSRASVADKAQVSAMEAAKQKELEAQKAQLGTQDPADIDAEIADAKTRQENTVDETANWRLGQQNWFGSGGHKFRDAMQNSVAATDTELAELKAKGELDAGGQARQEQLLNRQAQRKQMLGTYDREGGASGKGLFSTDMRNRVSGIKENIVAVNAQLRDPSLPPEERAKLEAQLRTNNEDLAEYRGWAESSK